MKKEIAFEFSMRSEENTKCMIEYLFLIRFIVGLFQWVNYLFAL